MSHYDINHFKSHYSQHLVVPVSSTDNKPNLIAFLYTPTGTLARHAQLDGVANNAVVCRFHRVPTGVDHFHASTGAQLLQSSHHQVHVLSHIAHLPDDPSDDCGHYAHLSGRASQSSALLV